LNHFTVPTSICSDVAGTVSVLGVEAWDSAANGHAKMKTKSNLNNFLFACMISSIMDDSSEDLGVPELGIVRPQVIIFNYLRPRCRGAAGEGFLQSHPPRRIPSAAKARDLPAPWRHG
jgi:hypothetical protein